MSINGNRWSKFWWQDWRSDPALRACSLTARGLWMELLCMAHEGTPYGHVTLGGRAPTNEQLSSIVGVSAKKIEKLIAELESAGVFSRDENGVMFCRRMVRDFATSEEGRQNISKRWGQSGPPPPNSPPTSEPNSEPNRRPNGVAISPPTGDPYSLEAEAEAEARKGDSHTQTELVAAQAPTVAGSVSVVDFETFWLAYPRKVGRADALREWNKATRTTDRAVILAALRCVVWPSNPRFIPHPAKWLNGERWLDEADPFDPVLRAVGLFPDDCQWPGTLQ